MSTLNIDNPLIILIALVLNIVIGFLAYKFKLVDKSGFYTGVIIGSAVYVSYGWEGFLILFSFFALGSLATKFKSKKKQAMGVAQKKEGMRSAKHVIANGGVPFILACAIAVATDHNQVFQTYFAAFATAVGTALGDTLSTEMGQVYGKRTYLLITMERTKAGTEGGVSFEGTMWGIAGSAFLAIIAALLGMFPLYPIKTAVLVTFAAVIANLIESIVSGVFNQFEKSPNEFLLNFSNTAIGAGLCFFFVH